VLSVGSLFSGIGGFDLGFERAGCSIAWQVEIDPWARAVLTKHWPLVPKHADIRDVGRHNLEPVDVLCGGFPCQDISLAGKGAGIAEGTRSGLWSEYVRVIRELRPRYVVVENVAALRSRGLDRVLGDLAGLRYDAEWSSVSACAMGLPHVRQRLFIVAYPDGQHGRPGVWDPASREEREIQALDRQASTRARTRARMADPSSLYGGAHGLPRRMDRNRGIGNAVCPGVIEHIANAILARESELTPDALGV
jgi:DNA (cytosine-5)-methyltransferase 1